MAGSSSKQLQQIQACFEAFGTAELAEKGNLPLFSPAALA
jgi:hypothetical protein